jgi:chromosome partition protein MukF
VTDHVDRVAAWGVARQKAWSDYYQFVQRYLRDVVRLDPDRAVSQRLRDLLGRWVDQPFGYVVADAPSIRLLRDFTAKVERPAVTRPLTDREPPLEDAEPAVAQDLDQRVLEAIDGGASTLAEVGAAVLRDIDPRSHFRVMGRITAAVARQATVAYPHERQWVTVNDELEAEDWSARSRGHDR